MQVCSYCLNGYMYVCNAHLYLYMYSLINVFSTCLVRNIGKEKR